MIFESYLGALFSCDRGKVVLHCLFPVIVKKGEAIGGPLLLATALIHQAFTSANLSYW